MKIQTEQVLFKVLTGSRLYGTNSENSDYDYKAICLPSFDEVLMNTKFSNRKVRPEGLRAGDKMLLGEDETEYIPIQVFFDDFFNGQTYALEIAFAAASGNFVIEGNDNKEMREFYQTLVEHLLNFTTNNVKKMVGYALSQSKMYGLKTERYASLKQVVQVLKDAVDSSLYLDDRLETDQSVLDKLLKLDFVKLVNINNSSAGSVKVPAIEVLGKQYLLANSLRHVYNSLNMVLNTYGNRVKEFEGECVDWKALSHAIRITEQILELCETGKLTFPNKNAEYLKKVKMGEVPLEEATDYLTTQFKKVDPALEKSKLPERTKELEEEFRSAKVQMLQMLYHKSMVETVEFVESTMKPKFN